MRRSGLVLLIALLGLLAGQTARTQRDVVDKIIVVVGDRVILASELASQIQLYAFQTGVQPKTEAEIEKLQSDILEQMINDQLFLLEAKQDTSISVRPEEIEQALDEHVGRVAANFDSQEAFIDALTAEGLTIRELKKKYRGDIENQLLRQRYIQRKLYSVSVSRHEVEEFYSQFRAHRLKMDIACTIFDGSVQHVIHQGDDVFCLFFRFLRTVFRKAFFYVFPKAFRTLSGVMGKSRTHLPVAL